MAKDVRKTHLLDRSLVDKDSELIKGLGTLDEANAFIGLAKVFARDELVKKYLEKIQMMIFKAGLELISDYRMSEKEYDELLNIIQEFESIVKKPRNFILLEKNESSAFLSVARTVVRRAEREIVGLEKAGKVSLLLVEWLNKLSYLIYLMNLRELDEKYDTVNFE
ncbi:ATP:cob(I)alamin adenosyltransferase [Archaeoglobus sulfaticallidus PM70-1]|uniref:ATP:cob(I)alamin adenosyltransferase n=1 Tax=Archaeoglobus sulfaticallidus PM70-1 TaxID=387631 RepID=N0BM56_9EURY|nr:ATP--cob(I)alamin adenosyltransferase [Archaeoglobus sulfaticallidus]AGK61686.1 ATP:cob(I)alamin adenosyltransferase [Archaeoglobus sulfaticallidus PM70-1]